MSILPLACFKSNADLANYRQRRSNFGGQHDIRKKVPIAIIDDEPFTPEVNLRSHGYNITQIGDIKRIEEVRDYKIVLCDLMGVGKHFDQTKQGAGIVQEIRANFPEKIVIAYSGAPFNSVPAKAVKSSADKILKKDADISEWREMLDEMLSKVADPHFVWQRTRLRLVEMDLDTKALLLLEDAYVRSVEVGDQSGSRLQRAVGGLSLPADIRSVIQSLVASAIFSLFFAA